MLITTPLPFTFYLLPFTSYLTPHTSHLIPHTSYLTPLTSYLIPLTSYLIPLTSYLLPMDVFSQSYLPSLSPHTSRSISLALLFAPPLLPVSLRFTLSLCRCPFLLLGFQPLAVFFCLFPVVFALFRPFLLAFASPFPFALLLFAVSLSLTLSLCRCPFFIAGFQSLAVLFCLSSCLCPVFFLFLSFCLAASPCLSAL